ncbi:MAG: HTTM domain-containing protein [Planctomycetota bacterium]|nr:HTTM domain-containing protein [Planctomycetota bacterium]
MTRSAFFKQLLDSWDHFWFKPTDTTTLGMMRILAGAIIFYTHFVWTFEFSSFFANDQILSEEHNRMITGSLFAWSHFHWLDSIPLLWGIHFLALACMLLFCLGLGTRITGTLTAFFTISYANRAIGATFGLDQINVMLAFYLAMAPSGSSLSLDSLLRTRKLRTNSKNSILSAEKSTLANFTTRLIQIHLCIIYLFAGCGKFLGVTWWNGEAIWGAIANSEYQTIDLTGLAAYPLLINLITHLALAWEASYFILVWPKWSKPFVIFFAVILHLGIGLAMGMVEFGLIMITANLAFVPPSFVKTVLQKLGLCCSFWPKDPSKGLKENN